MNEKGLAALIDAAEHLLCAYARGAANGGSVDWEDVDLAHEKAATALDLAYGRPEGRSIELAEAAIPEGEA